MKRSHPMPFGAEFRGEETRFALWAPQCADIVLLLGEDGAREVPMRPAGDGWHEAIVRGVRAGDLYRFRLPGGEAVPDPASRSNPRDVNGPSAVVDPGAYAWRDAAWKGRPWSEAVVYELHVGAFTPAGTFLAAIGKLDHLVELGVTAVELMPLADFPGRRNWGYDGVLPFAPDSIYGTPEDLKRLVDEAHARGLMALLDVVYNHFGPEGNHLHAYAPQFFNEAHRTPWGAAINFDGERSRAVRDFFVHNALYWIEEFGFDGLRMDAIHAIADGSARHIVREIAEAVAAGPGRERRIHLVLENEANEARHLDRAGAHAAAQWNDDVHHALHVLATGEGDGYYRQYARQPAWWLARALAEGFGFQGEGADHRDGAPRGERSTHLPPEAFVNFAQNHDQVGNRAMGERLAALAPPAAVRLLTATLCLCPQVPLFFMGDELGATTPFLFFCDYEGELASAVREGRRREFASFERFRDPAARERIPDPNAEETFRASCLDWDCLARAEHAQVLAHHRALLRLRAGEIVPRLRDLAAPATFQVAGDHGIAVDWRLPDGSSLHLRAAYGDRPCELPPAPGRTLHVEGSAPSGSVLPAWSGIWTLEEA